jgi:hypothetical protein
MNKEALYLTQEDLYRVGNMTSPRLTNIRPKDLTVVLVNGIKMIVANGNGVSLYNMSGLQNSALTVWVWKINAGSALPTGLYCREMKGGHYLLCPRNNMPLSSYAGLLDQVALRCEKVYKKAQ